MILFIFHQQVVQIFLKEFIERLTTSNVSISHDKRTKIVFSDRVNHVTIPVADNRSLKSLLTLFDKYLDRVLVNLKQNRILNFKKTLNFLKKWLTIFLQSVDAIFEALPVTKSFFMLNY